jgi:hypothetical protein
MACLGLAVLGCSGKSSSPDDRVAVMVPDDAGPPVCAGDASTDGPASSCWALGRLITRTGCADTHCDWDGGVLVRKADYAACGISAPDSTTDAPATSELSEVPGVLSLDDDQCEFHAFVVPECMGGPRTLYFDADLASMTGGVVPAGAKPYIEAFSSPVHIAPSTDTSTETTPGHYRIGPVTFDVPGQWTVTLHFFGTCRDDPQSAHAHVTFTLDVP